MEDTINSIIYGRLDVEVSPNLTLKQQLEVMRAIVCNPSSLDRVKFPKDLHPWASMILQEMKANMNNAAALQDKGTV